MKKQKREKKKKLKSGLIPFIPAETMNKYVNVCCALLPDLENTDKIFKHRNHKVSSTLVCGNYSV